MNDRTNVRCFLPKSEATKLLVVFQQIHEVLQEIAKESRTVSYNATDDFARSIDEAYCVIRERMANGGPGWTPK